VTETDGISLAGDELTPETIAERFEEVGDPSTARTISSGFEQTKKLAAAAMRNR
jgi:hypothetical protein